MPTTGTASTRHPLRGPQSESMVREKGWNTTDFVLPVPNLALIVNWYVPAVWGVPEMVAVPSSLLTKLMCFGSLPFFVIEGTGLPIVVTANEKGDPVLAVALFALVMTGGGAPTLNFCLSWGAAL